jgi:hypothetical protein
LAVTFLVTSPLFVVDLCDRYGYNTPIAESEQGQLMTTHSVSQPADRKDLSGDQSAEQVSYPSYVEYSSNNSGGSWWLSDQNWKDLEAAGWKVVWATLEYLYTEGGHGYVRDADGTPKLVPIGEGNSDFPSFAKDGRYFGALAKTAFRPNCNSLRDAAKEWERVTGQCATDAGCPCCGQPHTFTLYRDGRYVTSGPDASYSASW